MSNEVILSELMRANDGSTYEHSETILLLSLQDANLSAEEAEELIRERYTTDWCQHGHDCCGCWCTRVNMVSSDGFVAMVHLTHHQNV